MRNVTNGSIIVDRTPIGPKEGAGGTKEMPDDLRHALNLANMNGDEKLAKNPTQTMLLQLLNETKDKVGTDEGKKAFDKLNFLTTSQFGYVVAPYDKKTKETLRGMIPILGGAFKQYEMQDGTFTAVGPVRKAPVPFMNEQGEVALLFWSDAIKMAIDAKGIPIEETKNAPVPGEVSQPVVVPNLRIDNPAGREREELSGILDPGFERSVRSAGRLIGKLSESGVKPKSDTELGKEYEQRFPGRGMSTSGLIEFPPRSEVKTKGANELRELWNSLTKFSVQFEDSAKFLLEIKETVSSDFKKFAAEFEDPSKFVKEEWKKLKAQYPGLFIFEGKDEEVE
jgi:hypothetical protein